MATREVTLNLKKDKDGDYKIVADDNLKEVLFANAKSFGEDVWWEVIELDKRDTISRRRLIWCLFFI